MSNIKRIENITPDIYVEIYPFLKKGMSYTNDGLGIVDVMRDLICGNKQLWIVYDDDRILCVVITAMVVYPAVKRLLYYLVAGKNFDECFKHCETIEDWARDNGCTEVEIFGRRGWERKLKAAGFKLNYICMTNKL